MQSAPPLIPEISVFGQPNLTNLIQNGALFDGNTFPALWQVFKIGSKWAVLDALNSAVYIYSGAIGSSPYVTVGGAPALGKPTSSTLNQPYSASSDGTHLVIGDFGNNRVLIWSSIPTADGQPADVVVGQANFSAILPNRGLAVPTSGSLSWPYAVLIAAGKLLICDSNNNRILIYNTIPSQNGALADTVIGQADFVSALANRGAASPSSTSLNFPAFLSSNGTDLVVADSSNQRVLIWNAIPSSPATPADLVLGQAAFNTAAAGTTQSALNYPSLAFHVGSAFYVVDSSNNRILYWSAMPTTNGQNATGVIGQADFVTATPNRGAGFTPAANTLRYPEYAYSDGTKFWVADYGNSRVLEYATLPTSSADAASAVYGQSSLTAGVPTKFYSVNAFGFNGSYGSCASDKYLVVNDQYNSRFLVYDKNNPGGAALAVIGKPDFTSRCSDYGYLPPPACPAPTAATIDEGGFCAVDSAGRLYLADRSNHRVLVYNQIPTTNGVAADFVLGHDTFTSRTANEGAQGAGWLNFPVGLTIVGSKLLVADASNNRILGFDLPIIQNHPLATTVIGQPDFTTVTAGVSATALSGPFGLGTDGTRIFVADSGNYRVLIYNSLPSSPGAAANLVLGQANFTTGAWGSGINQFSYAAQQPAFADGYLYFPDAYNYRTAVFDLTSPTNGMAPVQFLAGQICPGAAIPDPSGSSVWFTDQCGNRVIRARRDTLPNYWVSY